MASTSTSGPSDPQWNMFRIQQLVQEKFQVHACWLQIKIALALYAGKDVIGCAPTGAGKTLSFWIPLLMVLENEQDKMTFVVTPLNILRKQNKESLLKAGLSAIAVNKNNAKPETFKDITDGKYHMVIINPEILMENEKAQAWWKKPAITNRLLNFIVNKGHCIKQWGGTFCGAYL